MIDSVKHIRKVPQLRPRATDAHKGTFGRVLVIGGSIGMAGAPSLVGLAALRSGAGLVTIAGPASIQPTIAALCPCATTLPLPETRDGQIDPVAARRLMEKVGMTGDAATHKPDALVVGPGWGTGTPKYGKQVWELIDTFREVGSIPIVADADALNLMPKSSDDTPQGWETQKHPRTVLTPHPGELARMVGISIADIQSDREGHAVTTARRIHAEQHPDGPVVVLKGAGTIVTNGWYVYTNSTGNPGMATGGSGDVLSGVIGALLAQGLCCLDAAILGVHLHGLAGDFAAEKIGQVSLIATDIIDALPEAFLIKKSPRRR